MTLRLRIARMAAVAIATSLLAMGCWGRGNDLAGKWSGTGDCEGSGLEFLDNGTVVFSPQGTAGEWSMLDSKRIKLHTDGSPAQVVGFSQDTHNSLTLTYPKMTCVFTRM